MTDPTAPLTVEPRIRTIEQLRATVSLLCKVIWNGGRTEPGQHLWSIPVNRERDFDCILSDGIAELEALRAEVQRLTTALEALQPKISADVGGTKP